MRVEITSGTSAGRSFEPGDEAFVVGREADCDLVLGDDEEVSRHHATFVRLGDGRLRVEDAGSHNGTFVNGVRISGPYPLSGGEEVRIGQTTMRVESVVAGRTEVSAAPLPPPETPEWQQPTTPPPPPPPPPPVSGKASGGWRAGAAIYAVIIGIVAGGAIASAIDLGGAPFCSSVSTVADLNGHNECVADTSGHRTIAAIALGVAGLFGAISAIAAAAFTITGRRWKPILASLVVAIAVYAVAYAVNVKVVKKESIPGYQPPTQSFQ